MQMGSRCEGEWGHVFIYFVVLTFRRCVTVLLRCLKIDHAFSTGEGQEEGIAVTTFTLFYKCVST